MLTIRYIFSALLALLFSPAVYSQVSAGQKASLIHAGRVLDVVSGQYRNDQAIYVVGDRIQEAGDFTAVQGHVKAGTPVVDLSRMTILPGLIDAHTHLLQNGSRIVGDPPNLILEVATQSTAYRALLGAEMGREDLEAGITTVRDLGNSGVNGDVALRNAIDNGWVIGPRMVVSTRALSAPGGQFWGLQHDMQKMVEQEYAVVSSPDEARRAVIQAAYDGADCIKVIVSEEITQEEMSAIVEQAHRSGKKVAAHAINDVQVVTAVNAGVDSIEHAYDASSDALRAMAAKHIYLVPTDGSIEMWTRKVTPFHNPTDEERKKADELTRTYISAGRAARLKRAMAAGVKIAAGSDVYSDLPGFTRGQVSIAVLHGYVESGMSPLEALRTATVNAAELLGLQNRIGTIEAGKFADIVAVAGDPLKDISEIERVSFVMKGGEIVRDARNGEAPRPVPTPKHGWY